MRIRSLSGLILFAAAVTSGCTHGSKETDEREVAPARTAQPAPVAVAPEGDNTEKNQNQNLTADDQRNDDSDLELTRQIRRSLTEDGSLSVYAHNVKIITENGHVTLKGPVRTKVEKQTVESRARQFAGADAVTSEVVITPR